MKWTSKFTCIAVFLTSLLLIFTMGRTNIRHFKEVNQSIEGIYKDRLVVNGIIYELSTLLHKKELALVSKDDDFFERTNQSVNLHINELIRKFKNTYLTEDEAHTLARFEDGVESLQKSENEGGKQPNSKKLLALIESLKLDLETLSEIQLSEGKRKLVSSEKAVSALELNQSIEHYSMLIIGFLIVLVLLLPVPKQD